MSEHTCASGPPGYGGQVEGCVGGQEPPERPEIEKQEDDEGPGERHPELDEAVHAPEVELPIGVPVDSTE